MRKGDTAAHLADTNHSGQVATELRKIAIGCQKWFERTSQHATELC